MSAWFYSDSGEAERWTGPHVSREAAIAAARADFEPTIDSPIVFVATGTPLDPSRWLPSPETIAEIMVDNASDDPDVEDAGEHFSLGPRAMAELKKLLATWCTRHATCTYHTVDGDHERVDLSATEAP